VTDEVFFIPGVNRGEVRLAVHAQRALHRGDRRGLQRRRGDPVALHRQPENLAHVRANVAKSGQIGRLVANDLKSALVQADLLEINPQTGEKLDYAEVAKSSRRSAAQYTNEQIDIHIVGFAKVAGRRDGRD
jgi:hypothetical protein